MPVLPVARDFLFRLIGKKYRDEEFEDVCFQIGLELDDITSEKEMYMREQGKSAGAGGTLPVEEQTSTVSLDHLSQEVLYKVETPANRYDLLSAEGLALVIKVFFGMMPMPVMRVLNHENPLYTMTVRKSVKNVRDYVVCAVLKNIKFNEHSYNSFIDFQDKLHSGLARRRTLASVGTHDLDKVRDVNFIYEAREKELIHFVPLRQTKMLNCAGNGLEEYYAADRHINKYCPLISSLPRYPVIMDSKENVLSLPPVINSNFSAMSVDTRNVLIECTAPDHHKATVLVNQIVCAFSQYCEEPFTVEAVKVEYEAETPDGTKVEICPDMSTRDITISVDRVNRVIGVDLRHGQDCADLLRRMMYEIKSFTDKEVVVSVPAVRSDVIGVADVMEDVGIAIGYDNIAQVPCEVHGTVTQTPLSKVGHLLRLEMANAGYLELLTFSLCSREDAFEKLGREDIDVAAHIANPQTLEFQVLRPSLMPGLLKTLSANKSQPLPHRLFECADVVMIDNEKNFPPVLELPDPVYPSPGARNQRHLAALHCSSGSSSFENIHGLIEYALMKLGVPKKGETPEDYPADGDVYTLEAGSDGAFFPGRAMNVLLHRKGEQVLIGHLGVVHPNTLKAYDIPYPCSFMELNIQFLCTKI